MNPEDWLKWGILGSDVDKFSSIAEVTLDGKKIAFDIEKHYLGGDGKVHPNYEEEEDDVSVGMTPAQVKHFLTRIQEDLNLAIMTGMSTSATEAYVAKHKVQQKNTKAKTGGRKAKPRKKPVLRDRSFGTSPHKIILPS